MVEIKMQNLAYVYLLCAIAKPVFNHDAIECFIDGRIIPEGVVIRIENLSIISCTCVKKNIVECHLIDSGNTSVEKCIVNNIKYDVGDRIKTLAALTFCICSKNNLMECHTYFNRLSSSIANNSPNGLSSYKADNFQNDPSAEQICVIGDETYSVGNSISLDILGVLNCICSRFNTLDCTLEDSKTNPHDTGRCFVNNQEYTVGSSVDTQDEKKLRCVCLANNFMQCYICDKSEKPPDTQSISNLNTNNAKKGCYVEDKFYLLGKAIPPRMQFFSCHCIENNVMQCITFGQDQEKGQRAVCLMDGREVLVGRTVRRWLKNMKLCKCIKHKLIRCEMKSP